MQAFLRDDLVSWDGSVSPTKDPNHSEATHVTRKRWDTNHEQFETKLVKWASVFLHIRPVIEYRCDTKRCEGLWITVEGWKCAPTNKLGPNESLGVDEYLIAKSNEPGQQELSYRFKLDWQWQFRLDKIDEAGNIVRQMWAEGPNDRFSNRYVTMQVDGNLLVQSVHWAKWASNTASAENAGSSLILKENGNAVIVRKDGSTVWQTNTSELLPPSQKDRLRFSEQLDADQSLVSPNGKFKFTAQKDCNLVVYGPSGVKWASST